jgi:hypothetical protein
MYYKLHDQMSTVQGRVLQIQIQTCEQLPSQTTTRTSSPLTSTKGSP